MAPRRALYTALVAAAICGCAAVFIGTPEYRPTSTLRHTPRPEYMEAAKAALSQPYRGITSDGKGEPGVFSISRTGISTAPIQQRVEEFIASLDDADRRKTLFPVDSSEWRDWSNIHSYPRAGLAIADMTASQRVRAFAILRESLSLKGFEQARDVMRLNETIAEMTGRYDQYGEGHYWFTIMGTPSAEEPWGWQLDGHHLVINYFVLKDQIVMTPTFMGSEPVYAASGKYRGIRVFADEEKRGLALMQMLNEGQRKRAILSVLPPREVMTMAFRDNFELRYEGLPYMEMSAAQQNLLIELIQTYVGSIRSGHSQVRMDEIRAHLPRTWFAWMGGTDADGVFYYRVHSPVVMIEFDHVRPIALPGELPTRNHIHVVVRTPNGNDYGKDLLRQHYEQSRHSAGADEHKH